MSDPGLPTRAWAPGPTLFDSSSFSQGKCQLEHSYFPGAVVWLAMLHAVSGLRAMVDTAFCLGTHFPSVLAFLPPPLENTHPLWSLP